MNCQKTPITRPIVREASERFLRKGGAVVRMDEVEQIALS